MEDFWRKPYDQILDYGSLLSFDKIRLVCSAAAKPGVDFAR
jgi:hypothetical protein